MNDILFWVLLPYDILVGLPQLLPYFWVKVAFGVATGLFIPRRIIGLVTCALGNVAIYAYTVFIYRHSFVVLKEMLHNPEPEIILLLAALVWWFVGRIMRWVFYKIRGRTRASAS